MTTQYLPQGDDLQRNIARRHLVGRIWRTLFTFAVVIAIIALASLVYTIVREAFGVVALDYTTDPNSLAEVYLDDDIAFDELSDEQLASIAVAPFDSDSNLQLLRGYFIQEFFGVNSEDNRDEFVTIARSTVAELFENGTYSEELSEKTIGVPPLAADEYRVLMLNNLSRERLEFFVLNRVAEERVVGSWPLNEAIFNYDEIEARIEGASSAASSALVILDRIENAETEIETAQDAVAAFESALDDGEVNYEIADAALDAVRTAAISTQEIADFTADLAIESTAPAARESSRSLSRHSDEGLAAARIAQETLNNPTEDDIDYQLVLDSLNESLNKIAVSIEDAEESESIIENYELAGAKLEFRSWIDLSFLTQPMNSRPEFAGIRVALLGSIWMIGLTILFAFPLGIGAAIYLEEYAREGWLTSLIRTNIANLAGVPSIVYGILGLAIFVRALEPMTSGSLFGYGDATSANGRTIISGSLTMGLLILPIIIINAQEAIRAVPNSIRQASYGLGATKWQTIWKQILPQSMPGIMTGTILAVSRAIGETAPLLVVGAATFITSNPNSPFSKFTVMPIQIFRWATEPEDEFRDAAAAAIVVLLIILLSLNSFAIVLRNRFSRR